MGVVSSAVDFMISIANDNSHGYDQAGRWGPDYDCSSLVITAYKQAGVPLTCTYTGNMLSDMLAKGFENVTSSVNLGTGAGLQKGDVLLNVVHHTAMYIGNGMVAQASINEYGSVTGGRTGDQTGKEIATTSYFNFPWNYVLRYVENEAVTPSTPPVTPSVKPSPEIQNGTYVTKYGDNLWNIALKFYGSGLMYTKIMEDNGLTSDLIHPGTTLKIGTQTPTTPEPSECTITVPILKFGDNGSFVRKIQAIFKLLGFSITVNGDFGSETKTVIEEFQRSKNIPITGIVDAKTYEALLS